MMVPTAQTDSHGGTRLDGLLGVAYRLPQAPDHRLALELGAPLYEHLDGVQMQQDWRFMLGWQHAF